MQFQALGSDVALWGFPAHQGLSSFPVASAWAADQNSPISTTSAENKAFLYAQCHVLEGISSQRVSLVGTESSDLYYFTSSGSLPFQAMLTNSEIN